ncbi:MAG: helix-turn-helix family protein [Rhizobiaceae bacterium]|jgi:transcriptional regulator with XRE-family HTH domain|nr:helix-turn-helix family protein [Rhizobiaceae bacterium]
MITGAQCRAARALTEISRAKLAERSRVDEEQVAAFERKLQTPDPDVIAALESALEEAGALFIPENGGGAGVRLKFNSSITRRIGVLENEGGSSRLDDVPGS